MGESGESVWLKEQGKFSFILLQPKILFRIRQEMRFNNKFQSDITQVDTNFLKSQKNLEQTQKTRFL